ncbi:MAG: small, acid-soluble spore protein, alpha/beta type [Firmicutes bacterium]|nr:small, acid-soluble spore protein, alpha/beta type [Bacillota bacterium]MCL5039389.1 small, acid-soluble spore protein, alpha/beta type [Bacillota bacterium]
MPRNRKDDRNQPVGPVSNLDLNRFQYEVANEIGIDVNRIQDRKNRRNQQPGTKGATASPGDNQTNRNQDDNQQKR